MQKRDFSKSSPPPRYLLFGLDFHKQVISLNLITDIDQDSLHHSGCHCRDGRFHFHGRQGHHWFSFFDLVSGLNFETDNNTEAGCRFLEWRMREGDTLEQAIEASFRELDGFYTFLMATGVRPLG